MGGTTVLWIVVAVVIVPALVTAGSLRAKRRRAERDRLVAREQEQVRRASHVEPRQPERCGLRSPHAASWGTEPDDLRG